jgi:hypothetical protein
MPVFAPRHQRFPADTCHLSIHTLRGHERPRRCPRGPSHDVRPGGMYHDRPGLTRDGGHGCRRPVNDLTHTRWAQRRRSLAHGMRATSLWRLACSSRHLAREVGVHRRTSSRGGWWRRHAARASERHRPSEGTGGADERYHTAGHTGPANHGGQKSWGRHPRQRRQRREPGRGHAPKARPARIAWGSRQGPLVAHAGKDVTVKTVHQAAGLAVQAGSRLDPDSASRSRALTGDVHEVVKPPPPDDARGEVHEHRAECLFSWLKPSLRVSRGLSNAKLPGSVGVVQCRWNLRQRKAFEPAELIWCAAFNPSMASRVRQGKCVTGVDHVDLRQTAIN